MELSASLSNDFMAALGVNMNGGSLGLLVELWEQQSTGE